MEKGLEKGDIISGGGIVHMLSRTMYDTRKVQSTTTYRKNVDEGKGERYVKEIDLIAPTAVVCHLSIN